MLVAGLGDAAAAVQKKMGSFREIREEWPWKVGADCRTRTTITT